MGHDLRRALAFVFVVAFGPPVRAQQAAWTPEAIVDLQAVSDAQVSPDGQTVAFVRSAWCRERRCSAVWRARIADGAEHRISASDADDAQPRWSPDGSRVAFLSRRPGASKLVVADMLGGSAVAVEGNVLDFAWARGGRRLACLVEEAGTTRLRIADAGSLRWLPAPAAQPPSIRAFVWSTDGTALIVAAPSESIAGDDRVMVLPLAGAARALATVEGRVGSMAVSDDGGTLAWLARPKGEWRNAVFLAPFAGGAARRLGVASHETPEGIRWRNDGRLAVSLRAGLQASLDLWLPSGVRHESAVPTGMLAFTSASSWAASGEPFALAAATAEHPAEVFVGLMPRPIPPGSDTVGAPPPPIRRLTHTNPRAAALPLGRQEIVRYGSPASTAAEALLLRPSRQPKARLPLVVGRVGIQPPLDGWTTDVRFPARALAERGLFVLVTQHAPSLETALADLLAGVDHLVGAGLADGGRVALVCDDPVLAAAAAGSRRFAVVAMVGPAPAPATPVLALRLDPESSRSEQIEALRRLLVEIAARLGS